MEYKYLIIHLLAATASTKTREPFEKRLAAVPAFKRLPAYEALLGSRQYIENVEWIYDSHATKINQNWVKFVNTRFGNESQVKAASEAGTKLDAWKKLSKEWHTFITEKKGINFTADILVNRPVAEDVALVIPHGHRSMMACWGFLESLFTLNTLPSEIFLFTGLDDTVENDLYAWLEFHSLLTDYYMLIMPSRVRVRWAVYHPTGGAAVGRWLAAQFTEKPIVIYNDNDDYMRPDAIEVRPKILRQRSDIDLVMSGYISWNPMEKNKSRAKVFQTTYEKLFKDPTDNSKVDELIKNVDPITETANIKKNYPKAFFEFGQLDGLPNLQYLTAQQCEELKKSLKERKVTGEDKSKEENSEAYIRYMCDIGSAKSPQYVGNCHNGWGAIRRDVMRKVDPNPIKFGEDALWNFMVSQYGFNVVCVSWYSSGLYKTFGKPEDLAIFEMYRV